MKQTIFLIGLLILVVALSGCEEGVVVPPECVQEGGAIPVIAALPECCEGLELIPPTEEGIVGIAGYCTANCGNGSCDAIESNYNCPEDCEAAEAATGMFTLLISDAEADIADFESVNVTFESARVFKAGTDNDTNDGNDQNDMNGNDQNSANGNQGFETIDLNGVIVDLTTVVGELAVPIIEIELAAGKYTKIELHVESVDAILLDGNTATVTVPSDKLQIVRPFTIAEGEETKFVFDIQVVRKGQSNEYNLKPVVGKSGVVGKDLNQEDIEEVEPKGKTETERERERLQEKAEEMCGAEDPAAVYVCGNHVRVVSELAGAGSTYYELKGNKLKEIASCPLVAPDAMSEECQELQEADCEEEQIC